ncbi:MAG: hypothetical protein ACFCUX_04960 [Candidatus Methylacidiphilales bacterium]
MIRIIVLTLLGAFFFFWIGHRIRNLVARLHQSDRPKSDPLYNTKKADVIDVR